MKKITFEGSTIYRFGQCHAYTLPEDALIYFVDVIIEKYGKSLTLDKTIKFGNNCYMSTFTQAVLDVKFGEYYKTPIYPDIWQCLDNELQMLFPNRNLFAMYKKRCNNK